MDTLSRDSNGSGSILPLVGVIAGGLALVLSITALFKLSTLQKAVAAHDAEIAKIATLESDVRATATKADADVKSLRSGIQTTFDQVGAEIGTINAKIAKIEEAQKARAAAPAAKGGAAAPTGVLNADGTYTIGSGDTLAKVARKFAVKLDAIEAENPGLDPAKLKVGQKIRIPRK
ncbi:MAG: LysM domain-containing protein [Lacunisphaera sp.]|nr:LysM domain-containing protein [Lacunisphaera sp.]